MMSPTVTGKGAAGASPAARPLARLARYGGVSVIATVLAQAALALGYGVMRWPAVAAVTLSLAVSAPPAYVLSRRYVWRDAARTRPVHGEAAAFLAVALVGAAATVGIVWLTVQVAGAITTDHVMLSFVANISSLVATGVMWLARYAVLDRFLFVRRVV